jgi:DNA-binding SARP family transcriptional activator/tetratricopeptide (TPR) repeat protein
MRLATGPDRPAGPPGPQVRLLGPVSVVVDGAERPLNGRRRKVMLAVLALHPRQSVSVDQLADIVWGDDTPSGVSNAVQTHISYLRGVLGRRDAIRSRPPGYLLDLPAGSVDVQEAERRLSQARAATEPPVRARELQDALGLWRGPSLADVTGDSWLDDQAGYLDQLRWRAERSLIETRMSLGEHEALIPRLERLVRDHPLDEHLHEQLAMALFRGRQPTAALGVLDRLRRHLREELGLDPGRAVRDLEAALRNQDPVPGSEAIIVSERDDRAAAARPIPSPVPGGPVPAQLPADVRGFSGRAGELAALDAVLGPLSDDPAGVTVVSGTAGLGKTALAVHWAHRARAALPDGPVDPAEVLAGFLHALGAGADIPVSAQARAAAYRTTLDGRRMLVVLDNASSVEQVRPLLPGTSTAVTIVTSRDQMAPLIADGARSLRLDALTVAEGRDLLSQRLGADRAGREPAAVEQILAACSGLPLALVIVAAWGLTHPSFPLASVARELAGASSRLDALATGDVRTVFSWSYATLSAPAARAFRLLGLHPGPDVSRAAMSSLTGLSPAGLRGPLGELAQASLVTEHAPGRYIMHDLVREYAAELAAAAGDGERTAAAGRLLDHYLHTADAGHHHLRPQRDPIPLPLAAPASGTRPEPVADRSQAAAWFAAEQPVLLSLLRRAVDTGENRRAWQLAWSLKCFLSRPGRWHDLASAGQAALIAAERIKDARALGHAHRLLGFALSELVADAADRAAEQHLSRAVEIFAQAGDAVGEADTHRVTGHIWEGQHHPDRARAALQRALRLYADAGHLSGQANVLNHLGWLSAHAGDHAAAIDQCERSVRLHEQTGDLQFLAFALDSLGFAHHQARHYRTAVGCYRQAQELFRETLDQYDEAVTFDHLGDSLGSLGEPEAAEDAWSQAADILEALEDPLAAVVRAKLASARG